ncbi:MAG: M48 family metallopeptidase [Gilvibacter sp.]
MEPTTLFIIIIGILIASFVVDNILDYLNAKRFDAPVPALLNDVYDAEAYQKSQRYKATTYRFAMLSQSVSFIAVLLFFFFDGFALVDNWVRQFSENDIIVALLFFGIIMLASSVLSMPFSYYRTFVIEEQFGFNKTTRATFFTDKLKGAIMAAVIGGGLLALIIFIYQKTGANFWWYAWIVVTVFTVFMNFFYARLIVPIFNKQTALPEGSLRDKISQYASSVGFTLSKIFVIDGSKRSTRANAYFSGFGAEKRITLYDTLIDDLSEEEIVAVLAHEVGHYKRNHIIINLIISVILTGFTLWLFSLFVNNQVLSSALGVEVASFHIGLITFGILYTPISEVTGLLMNYLSRKFEYQADDYAAQTYQGGKLISALKALAKNNLSNLTPHPAYVIAHYSHPPLYLRFKNILQQD